MLRLHHPERRGRFCSVSLETFLSTWLSLLVVSLRSLVICFFVDGASEFFSFSGEESSFFAICVVLLESLSVFLVRRRLVRRFLGLESLSRSPKSSVALLSVLLDCSSLLFSFMFLLLLLVMLSMVLF